MTTFAMRAETVLTSTLAASSASLKAGERLGLSLFSRMMRL
jgi:hypothetical protein